MTVIFPKRVRILKLVHKYSLAMESTVKQIPNANERAPRSLMALLLWGFFQKTWRESGETADSLMLICQKYNQSI